jgi:hypothetical protein
LFVEVIEGGLGCEWIVEVRVSVRLHHVLSGEMVVRRHNGGLIASVSRYTSPFCAGTGTIGWTAARPVWIIVVIQTVGVKGFRSWTAASWKVSWYGG